MADSELEIARALSARLRGERCEACGKHRPTQPCHMHDKKPEPSHRFCIECDPVDHNPAINPHYEHSDE